MSTLDGRRHGGVMRHQHTEVICLAPGVPRRRGRRPLLSIASALLALAAGGFLSLAWAADCPDADNDGAVVCGGCDVPDGKVCGDCNDANPAIHPGVTEYCGDGIDNNCDGLVDFDDTLTCCTVNDPPSCSPGDAGGCCRTAGHRECDEDDNCVCVANGPLILHGTEGPAGDSTCFDLLDNDCDGLKDHQEPDCQTGELCNGFDDDNDGFVDENFALGLPCTVGQGLCEEHGVTVCSPDHTGTVCSKSQGAPGVEGPLGGPKCSDGIDNDCDGHTDLGDTDCQGPERCDGKDNDGDGSVDEDFTDLGDACANGVGACETSGTRVCAPDGSGTVCGAVPAVPGVEGPAGVTCGDGIDNDCDGVADGADSS